ncbi:unnamed protein product, partial [Didymodactylos carnosus]
MTVQLMACNRGLLDIPLQYYLERLDLWTNDITELDIQTIEVSDEILLKHTFVILGGLELRVERQNQTDNDQWRREEVGSMGEG